MIDIRPYRGSDAGDLALIFHDAVQRGTGNHYDQAQRNAWSPRCPAPHDWARRLAGGQTIVASTGGRSVGFMSWQEDGYLDLMFVHPDFMGRGIGDALYWVMHNRSLAAGISQLRTDASHLAKPFLMRHGWVHEGSQNVIKNNVELTNHRMQLGLG